MSDLQPIRIPDIGDFDSVDVIEVLVSVGDSVEAEEGLITLETDKATMDIPAPVAGTVTALTVSVGDQVSEGDVIGEMSVGASEAPAPAVESQAPPATPETPAHDQTQKISEATAAAAIKDADARTQMLVLGAGPGGYAAAFRAADLGMEVTLIERYESLGGVCLNVGCIPSKALLHAAKVIDEAESMADHGIVFGKPEIDSAKLGEWKGSVVSRLTGGLSQLAKQRKVKVVHGTGRFVSPNAVAVTDHEGNEQIIGFEQCIIAAGSAPIRLPFEPDDARIVDSTGALQIDPLPESLLVVGGGIIGLELGSVYATLGVAVTVVELTSELMPGADRDLVRPLQKRLSSMFDDILLNTKVTGMSSADGGVEVSFEDKNGTSTRQFGKVLVAVGRRANGEKIDAAAAGVNVDERGQIPVDKQMRTNVPHIFAIGDIVGQPMLAHKATHEGHVAAEVAAGEKRFFDARVIPSVAYTDPEVAWVGLTETDAKRDGVAYEAAAFPWAASGRSLAMGRDEGKTKILFEPGTGRVLGGGIVGTSAGDIIGEIAFAIEMGADAEDLGLTIHPHPTLGETVGLTAEAYEGTLTDLYIPKKKKH
ncbi:MAG: dihydrolipoyl dehydrogenase [Pseudomonadota bacterium]